MNEPTARYDQAEQFTAAGGWRAIVAPRPDSTTLAIRWLVAAGGQHDGPQPGLSHLAEHLVFRAAGPGRLDLVTDLLELGAECATRTTREYLEFQALVAAPHRPAALALLPELARPPLLDERSTAHEKEVIVRELVGRATPSRLVWDLLHEALWGDHPLARAPGGTPASVLALEPRLVADHHAARFRPRTTVLAVVGACTADEVRTAMAPLAAATTTGVAPPDQPEAPIALGPRSLYHPAPTEVTHVAVAVPVPGMTDAHRSALRLLDYVLGRGGSSRLHRELRERRSLTYSCSSVFMPYASVGVFAAQAVCAPERAGEVLAVLRESLLGLSLHPPTGQELKAAQQRYAGALYRTFETNANLAQILAVETLLAEWEPFDTSVARIGAVTSAAVAEAAARYLVSDRLVSATLGPVDPAGS